EPADHLLAEAMHKTVAPGRIADDLGAVERRAQHRRVRDFAAEPAADARFHDRGHRIGPQRVGCGLHRQRRAARQADAGVVTGADFLIHAVAHARDAFAALELFGIFAAHAALTRELAFPVRDDDLEAALGGFH